MIVKSNDYQRNQLSNREAAKYLGLSEATLNVWRCKRKGPSYRKVGRRIFYPQIALDEFLENCRIDIPAL